MEMQLSGTEGQCHAPGKLNIPHSLVLALSHDSHSIAAVPVGLIPGYSLRPVLFRKSEDPVSFSCVLSLCLAPVSGREFLGPAQRFHSHTDQEAQH